jgi:hypothetical protein
MRTNIFILFLILLSCKAIDKKEASKETHAVSIVNSDSVIKTDSIKWYYYMMNYYGKAIFYDTLRSETVKYSPLECDVVLENYERVNEDSAFYVFSFAKSGMVFKRVDELVYCTGIKIINKNIYPMLTHVTMDYEKNVDSTKIFLQKRDSSFRKYLKNYKEEITPWLKKEAIRRKIL